MEPITLDKKSKKESMKKKRLPLLDRQTELNRMNCNRCTSDTCISCPITEELQEIGRKLLDISKEAYEPPGQLTWSAYQALKEREWDNKRIIEHYGIYKGDLYEFIKLNKNPKLYLEEEKEMVAQQKETGKVLTLERYVELKKQKKSDSKIQKEFGLQAYDLHKFKKKHGLVKNKEAVSATPEKTADEVSAVLSHVLPAEPAAPKENPLGSLVNELRAKIEGLELENANLKKENLEISAERNEYYQNYAVAKSGLKEYVDKVVELKKQHGEEIQKMNKLLEKAHQNDTYLTHTLEILVQSRKLNEELLNQ